MISDAGRIPILVVCTGNICRSPLAEQLFVRQLRGLPFGVSSAGTAARAGTAMPDAAQAVALALGAEAPERHRARPLIPQLAAEARLVLTATRAHRRSVVELAPSAVRRTFTLREFARLAATDPSELPAESGSPHDRFDALVAALSARRIRVSAPENDDIVDPYGAATDVYRTSGEQIATAITPIVTLLRQRFTQEH
ncbi:low molecular weight phosphatase family protein [Leifsonia sp. Le1]|uniref:arsenate reductase/protein-tyrosine-phosphatase family protein n=1 Tax=Leifsonia sp. Le1 TaxID=3404918 RepID=UPI003EBD701A